ncbi:cell division protein ZapE [Mesobacterium pallidum]|uniref:cell division protein ZapE n=1 Tax=Mesobacterium pallidum TaxID=2872037 RepID=UPI001EE26FEC|nr:cell division protein ZapE [Mesobacterium pallidum]
MTSVRDAYDARVAAGELTPDPAQLEALPDLDRIRVALHQPVKRGLFRKPPEPPRGLYMWGGVGRGKSMLMDLFVSTLDVPARRVHFHAFMQEVQRALTAERKAGTSDPIKPVAARMAEGLRVLAFDEMQITDIADAMIVGRLFELMMQAGVVIVTTSNRVPDDLYKDGLNRALFLPFIELLKQKMVVHELVSHRDYRQDRLAGRPVYFTPDNAESRAAFARLWKDLTGNDVVPLDIEVLGRTVTLPAYSNGAGRTSFHALCGAMLGPADYLAVAESVRVLFLEGIPSLSRSNFNEAKRFVTLIDALYEAKVRLICTAAAEPEYLYVEGEGSFEFERTASRLREMQAEDWGDPSES